MNPRVLVETHASPSKDEVTMMVPSPLKLTEVTGSEWAGMVRIKEPGSNIN